MNDSRMEGPLFESRLGVLVKSALHEETKLGESRRAKGELNPTCDKHVRHVPI